MNPVNDNYMVSTPRTHLTGHLAPTLHGWYNNAGPYLAGITKLNLTWLVSQYQTLPPSALWAQCEVLHTAHTFKSTTVHCVKLLYWTGIDLFVIIRSKDIFALPNLFPFHSTWFDIMSQHKFSITAAANSRERDYIGVGGRHCTQSNRSLYGGICQVGRQLKNCQHVLSHQFCPLLSLLNFGNQKLFPVPSNNSKTAEELPTRVISPILFSHPVHS